MTRKPSVRPLLTFLSVLAVAAAPAQGVPDGFVLETIVFTGVEHPNGFCFLPGGSLVVAEQSGDLVLVGWDSAVTLGTIPGVSSLGGESGPAGIAAHPDLQDNGWLYVWYPHASGTLRLERMTLIGGPTAPASLVLDPTLSRVLLEIPMGVPQHHGGGLAFGPDGMLYLGVGDGSPNGPLPQPGAGPCRAQDPASLRGALLRLDVGRADADTGRVALEDLDPGDNPLSGSDVPAERLVLAIGLRNPFRIAVDPLTGDVAIGDVGRVDAEEVNVWHRAASHERPANFGWPLREGTVCPTVWGCGSCGGPAPSRLADPVVEIARSEGWRAVIGGPFYRNPAGAPHAFGHAWEGALLFGDYVTGEIRVLPRAGRGWSAGGATTFAAGLPGLTQMDVGPDGALYLTQSVPGSTFGGDFVRRIRPAAGAPLEVGLRQDADAPGRWLLVDTGLVPGRSYRNLVAVSPCSAAPGSGPFFGLCPQTPAGLQLLLAQLAIPPGVTPFHFVATAPEASFGPFLMPLLPLEIVCLELTPTGIRGQVSPVLRL